MAWAWRYDGVGVGVRRVGPVAVLLSLIVWGSGCLAGQQPVPNQALSLAGQNHDAPLMVVGHPVNLGAYGYEPSIALDTRGNIYISAHKEFHRPDTWPYPASWMVMSRDGGSSFAALRSPSQLHEAFPGIEGDVAVDGRDWVYFVDMFMAESHLHAWSAGGARWERSGPFHTEGLDDRPWLAAQGNGILHYLGNNGATIQGGRVWYYRSTDGGQSWAPGVPLPSTGWAHVAAERRGVHAYIVTEAVQGAGELVAMASNDAGATWSSPRTVFRHESVLTHWPVVTVDEAGIAFVLFDVRLPNGSSRLFLSRTIDYGSTWDTTEITPFPGAAHYYPTVAAGPPGVVGVAFYGSRDVPLSGSSRWYLYGGLATATGGGSLLALGEQEFAPPGEGGAGAHFGFSILDPRPVYVGENPEPLHDFFEAAIDSKGSILVAYNNGSAEYSFTGQRALFFVQARLTGG